MCLIFVLRSAHIFPKLIAKYYAKTRTHTPGKHISVQYIHLPCNSPWSFSTVFLSLSISWLAWSKLSSRSLPRQLYDPLPPLEPSDDTSGKLRSLQTQTQVRESSLPISYTHLPTIPIHTQQLPTTHNSCPQHTTHAHNAQQLPTTHISYPQPTSVDYSRLRLGKACPSVC